MPCGVNMGKSKTKRLQRLAQQGRRTNPKSHGVGEVVTDEEAGGTLGETCAGAGGADLLHTRGQSEGAAAHGLSLAEGKKVCERAYVSVDGVYTHKRWSHICIRYVMRIYQVAIYHHVIALVGVYHIHAHTPMQVWECNVCAARYLSRNKLFAHIKACGHALHCENAPRAKHRSKGTS